LANNAKTNNQNSKVSSKVKAKTNKINLKEITNESSLIKEIESSHKVTKARGKNKSIATSSDLLIHSNNNYLKEQAELLPNEIKNELEPNREASGNRGNFRGNKSNNYSKNYDRVPYEDLDEEINGNTISGNTKNSNRNETNQRNNYRKEYNNDNKQNYNRNKGNNNYKEERRTRFAREKQDNSSLPDSDPNLYIPPPTPKITDERVKSYKTPKPEYFSHEDDSKKKAKFGGTTTGDTSEKSENENTSNEKQVKLPLEDNSVARNTKKKNTTGEVGTSEKGQNQKIKVKDLAVKGEVLDYSTKKIDNNLKKDNVVESQVTTKNNQSEKDLSDKVELNKNKEAEQKNNINKNQKHNTKSNLPKVKDLANNGEVIDYSNKIESKNTTNKQYESTDKNNLEENKENINKKYEKNPNNKKENINNANKNKNEINNDKQKDKHYNNPVNNKKDEGKDKVDARQENKPQQNNKQENKQGHQNQQQQQKPNKSKNENHEIKYQGYQPSQNKVSKPHPKDLNQYTTVDKKLLLTADEMNSAFYKPHFNNILDFIKNKLYVEKNSNILVGVSGGVDSVVLLDSLLNLSQVFPMNIAVAHLNHELRGDNSNGDAVFVKSFTEKFGLKFYSSSIDVKSYANKYQLGIEEAARTMRYKFFTKVATNEKYDFVALAHNSNDSVETFFLNLFRGSGLTGLSGIPAKRNIAKSISVIRPMLNLSKKDIKAYAENRNLSWREDESNAENNFLRNKIRNELIPIIEKDYSPGILNVVSRTTRIIQSADKFIGDRIKGYVDKLTLSKNENSFELNISSLHSFNNFIQAEIIANSLQRHLNVNNINSNYLEKVVDISNKETNSQTTITDGIVVLRDREKLIFRKPNLVEKINERLLRDKSIIIGKYEILFENISKEKIVLSEDKNVEYFDSEFMPMLLTLRNWESGDKFTPLGMEGTVKVSDFLTNQKVNHFEKQEKLVLTDGVDIIWLVGERIAEKYKISEDTKEVLKVTITKN